MEALQLLKLSLLLLGTLFKVSDVGLQLRQASLLILNNKLVSSEFENIFLLVLFVDFFA